MITCDEITTFISTYLNAANIPDDSYNGLQVQGKHEISKIVFGVSAGLELFKAAQAAKADMIIVHHGLLWGKEQPIVGLFRKRVGFLLEHNINLLGYHLPLDMHPAVGHNASLLRALNAHDFGPFGQYHGLNIGYRAQVDAALGDLVKTLQAVCGARATVLPYGQEHVRTVGVVSGGGWSILPQAIEKGLDLYITGSLEEPVQELCREGRINCVALGHYNSEKIGVKALMEVVEKHFNIPAEFIDIPNPI